MKSLVVLAILSFVALSLAKPSGRGCVYVLGRCHHECEEGTHSYSVGCSQKIPEPTCDAPEPVKEEAIICDYSACYCDAPTVRDTKSGKCVTLDKCPKKAEKN